MMIPFVMFLSLVQICDPSSVVYCRVTILSSVVYGTLVQRFCQRSLVKIKGIGLVKSCKSLLNQGKDPGTNNAWELREGYLPSVHILCLKISPC